MLFVRVTLVAADLAGPVRPQTRQDLPLSAS
jgi:hypothetical protein